MERQRQILSALGIVSLFAFGGCKSDFEFTLPPGHPALSGSSIGSPPNAASPYDQDFPLPETPSSSGIENPASEPPSSDGSKFTPGSNMNDEQSAQKGSVSS